MYDFSRAAEADIIKAVNSVKDALAKSPGSANAKDWKAYIDAGEAELAKRKNKRLLMIGAAAVAAYFFMR